MNQTLKKSTRLGANQSSQENLSTRAYHVLKVVENSPADISGLNPYFDWIMAVNNVRLDEETPFISETVRGNVGKPIAFVVYSSKTQQLREVTLTPSQWGHPDDGFLGCSVRFCDYEGAADHVWHVLDIHANSPAEKSGLNAYTDYIIGTPHTILHEKDDLYTLIEKHVGSPLQLFVYNTEWDNVREVLIVPSHGWGGNGCLGCDIGYGYLHRIPSAKQNPPTEANSEVNIAAQLPQQPYTVPAVKLPIASPPSSFEPTISENLVTSPPISSISPLPNSNLESANPYRSQRVPHKRGGPGTVPQKTNLIFSHDDQLHEHSHDNYNRHEHSHDIYSGNEHSHDLNNGHEHIHDLNGGHEHYGHDHSQNLNGDHEHSHDLHGDLQNFQVTFNNENQSDIQNSKDYAYTEHNQYTQYTFDGINHDSNQYNGDYTAHEQGPVLSTFEQSENIANPNQLIGVQDFYGIVPEQTHEKFYGIVPIQQYHGISSDIPQQEFNGNLNEQIIQENYIGINSYHNDFSGNVPDNYLKNQQDGIIPEQLQEFTNTHPDFVGVETQQEIVKEISVSNRNIVFETQNVSIVETQSTTSAVSVSPPPVTSPPQTEISLFANKTSSKTGFEQTSSPFNAPEQAATPIMLTASSASKSPALPSVNIPKKQPFSPPNLQPASMLFGPPKSTGSLFG
ncbi:hypothetical protein HK096_007930 [Nowakowskiella sp. JEL0078]|nr:hypothetical protein HK096_007930 [Nowakowskiella sp. JEL0078]